MALTADGRQLSTSEQRPAILLASFHPKRSPAFEVTSKRRKGYPSETRVKRGDRTVHGNKELLPREVGPQ